MVEKVAFENERISNFQGLMTWTLDQVILHTIVHHSSASTYTQYSIEIRETFCGWRDICTYGHLRPTLLSRLRRVNLQTGHMTLSSPPWGFVIHRLIVARVNHG